MEYRDRTSKCARDNEHVPPIISKGRVFVKNAINSFFLDVQYKKKLLVTFPPKTLPLEIIGGTGSLSLAQNVVQSRYIKGNSPGNLSACALVDVLYNTGFFLPFGEKLNRKILPKLSDFSKTQ